MSSSFHERLARARGDGGTPSTKPEEATPHRARRVRPDPLAELRQKVHRSLVEVLGPRLYDTQIAPEQLQAKVREILQRNLEEEDTPLTREERLRLTSEIADDVLGFGPIEPFLRDPTVTEIMVNAPDLIYVEREGRIHPTMGRFVDETHLRRVIDRMVGQIGRRIDESSPYVDARLPDGSRVNAVLPPLCVGGGPYLTVRKFSPDPFQAEDLITFGTMSARLAAFFAACVHGRMNLLVSGGTGAGKTTTLNVLSSWIPSDERIVTIEDAAELQLRQPHWLRLEYRPPNIEGRGEVTIRDLVRNSLRMRPDRIVVGEVRGGEALDMLQSMNTGHDGSLSTIHANSPRDSISRLETMVLMAGVDIPVRAIREQIAAAIDLVVHQARMRDGTRRITQVTEVVGMEGDVVTLQDLFTFDYRSGMDDQGRYRGTIQPTGLRPRFSERLGEQGVRLDPDLFAEHGGTIPIAMRRS
ncbi:MAG TPA: CpaF family protein [Actinomycetota bacterium]|jgi:pilus assembly protein CpaF|nr:CpaF family protein [Actinomycetota bacterium]